MQILSDQPQALQTHGPDKQGYVIEAIIEARLAWLVQPVPLQPYTFTFNFAEAHVFETFHEARDTCSCVWCGYFDPARGRTGTIDVYRLTDEYRAQIARDNDVTPTAINP